MSFRKKVYIKFLDLSEMNNFVPYHFFVSRIVWPENRVVYCQKTVLYG